MRTILSALGIAPLFTAFRRDGIAALFEVPAGSASDSRGAFLATFIFAAVIACVALVQSGHVGGLFQKKPRVAFLAGALASLSGVAMYFSGGFIGASPLVVVAVCLFYSFWLASSIPAWGVELTRESNDRIVLATSLAYVASLVPSSFRIVSDDLLCILVALEPVVSSACLFVLYKINGPRCDFDRARTAHEGFAGMLGRVPVLLAVLVFAGGVARGFLNNGAFTAANTPLNLVTHALSAGLVLAMLFFTMRKGASEQTVQNTWAILFVFLLGSLLLCSFISVQATELVPIGRSLVIAGNTCLTVLFFTTLPYAAKRGASISDTVAVFSFYTLVQAASSIVSYLLVPAIASYFNVSLGESLLACTLATSFVLVMATMLCFGGIAIAVPTVQTVSDQLAEPDEPSLPDRLRERYDLTDREAQVALLVAQGHTFESIAERLCLSTNTVRSYAKDVYRKLGVHKKQEVIDLLAR